MTAYLVVSVRCHDTAWTEGYRREIPALLERFGGKYLVKTFKPERLEGNEAPIDTLAIVTFPTAAHARDFMNSPDYKPWADARRAGADTEMHILEA